MCLFVVFVAVTTLDFSRWFLEIQSGRSLQSRRGLTIGEIIEGTESSNGRLSSASTEVYATRFGRSLGMDNAAHRFRVKRTHLFKEKMSKFASRSHTNQTDNTQRSENFLTGSKRIVGGKFLL